MTDGAQLKDWVLLIAGNILIIIIVIRAIGYYAKREWGELIGHILAGILVGALVWATDSTINLIKQIGSLIF